MMMVNNEVLRVYSVCCVRIRETGGLEPEGRAVQNILLHGVNHHHLSYLDSSPRAVYSNFS
jgi:hypothetical protein